ncbi:iron ABC transporter permease [Alteromonas sp. ASW11-36]|uniref:Iron ABC transporter permease n=1 Tax=Alteromonas arenosi TaxID=3055817 RepID=A0ABT7SY92_9ALTE|nr:iron ABC transporter permease [Alteromonas sp. ASW11-36]MDM7861135.1 iron ABC transporter permease [Alteromonas sp. ASW11-36]
MQINIAQWRIAQQQRFRTLHLWLAGVLVLSVMLSLTQGAMAIDLLDALSELEQRIITEIRAPRALMTVATGAGLAICGLVLQAICRNPLADPGLVGVASGAALFASLAILLSSSMVINATLTLFFIPAMAFVGAALALFLLLAIANYKGSINTLVLILSGVAINAGAATLLGLITFVADDNTLRLITFWQLGSYSGIDWSKALLAGTLVLIALCVFWRHANAIMLLQIGEQHARFQGVHVDKLKRVLLITVAFVTAICVCFTGIVGFVGLVVPHICRMLVGTQLRILLPIVTIVGGALVTLADVAARVIIVPAELPIGLLTSALGVPFFLWLILREKRRFSHA